MGAPYSQDLRVRVLAALDGGMNKRQAHKTFGISRSTIDDWLRLHEQTGSVTANITYRRGRAPALGDGSAFATFAQAHQHSTLEQLALAWQEEGGQQLSHMTFSRMLRRIGSTRKKELLLSGTQHRRAPGLRAGHSRGCRGRPCLCG